MSKSITRIVGLWGLLFFISSCSKDDNLYPSVKMEFVTVVAGVDGLITTLIPDQGEELAVSDDRTNSLISPSESKRVLSNYETLSVGGAATAVIYSLQSVVEPMPKPIDDPAFKDGLKHDPVKVASIWMGKNYLNMILQLKVTGGKQHIFGIVEDLSELETKGIINLLLYHDADGDEENYNRNAYLSVPLEKYADAENPGKKVSIKFKFYTYDSDGSVVVSDKYSEPGFEYTPGGK